MKHINFFLKFVVTATLAGYIYSADESPFDLFSSQIDAQLDCKSRRDVAATATTTVPRRGPTMRISLETNIDYEYLKFLYLKEVESIRFFAVGRMESAICKLNIKDINAKNSQDGRFNLNEAFPMPDDSFKIAYQLMRNNKPIAPSVFISDKDQVSLIRPYNASMQWISAIRLGAVVVRGNDVCFTLLGCKYGESIPTFSRASLSLAAPGLSNDLGLLRSIQMARPGPPSQFDFRSLEEICTTYLTLAQLNYGVYFCAKDQDQVIEFFLTYNATAKSNKAILENCFSTILKKNAQEMRMIKPFLVFMLTPTLTNGPASIVAAYYE